MLLILAHSNEALRMSQKSYKQQCSLTSPKIKYGTLLDKLKMGIILLILFFRNRPKDSILFLLDFQEL
jgi:hypothetical protein